MASFFDDFNEKKKKKKSLVQTVTPAKAVKAKQETKQATQTKTVSQAAKATVNKNKSFAKAYENKKKVSLPTVTKPSLPKQTMNGSLRTPVQAMGETKKRAAQNTAVETRRRNQQTLSAADKKLSPVQQRAVQTYKANWDAAEARGDRAAMNLAHQRAEDIRRQQGYSGGVAGNEYISPKIYREDRNLLNDSGQLAMKQAKLDYDRASATGNTMGMKEAILEMTALRKGEKYRSMDMQSAVGTDAYGRPIYGKTQREQLMGEAMGKAIPGSMLALRETANTALRNQARQRWTADKTPEMVNPNALGQRLMRESNMAGAMATQDLSGGKKLLAETAISMGQMLPGMAASAIPVVGPAIGAAMLSGQAAGAKAFELNERGILPGEVMPRALLTGGIEGLTEAIPLARLGNILTGSAGRSLVKNVLGQMGVEATEESIAYTANYLADKAFKDPEAVWTIQELGRNALAGAIAGGALAGAGTMFNPNAQPQEENARRVFNGTDVRNPVENVESGLVRDDYTSRQDQKAMDEIDAASKLMGVQVGFQARTPGGMPRAQGNQIILEQGTQAPARFMFGRQLAGWMEQAAPESYGQFKAIIRNEPGVQSQVRAIMEDAKELGMAYTEEQALDQVAADYAGTLMENDGVLRSFTEKAKGNKPMLQQMSEGLRSLGQRLTGRQAQKAQNAAEALELAMHETIKGNRLLTGKEQRIKNRQMAQAQRWDLDRRDAITERLTEMYQDDHLPAAVRARVDQVGIEGMVDEYLNGNLPADLREFGRAIEAYEELNRNYSFLRPEEYSSAIAEATEVARQLGLNLEMADQVAEGRANAEIEGNTVRIEKWNPNPVRFLFGHEMTHYLQEKTPDSYNQFRDHVMQTVGPDAVRNKIQEYADHGVELTTDQAIDEIVADYAGQLVENRDLLNKFIQDNRQNKTMLERVLEAIRNLAAKLTGKKKTQAEEAAALLEKAMQEVRGQVKQGTEVATEATTEATTDEVKVGDEAATYEEDGKRYSIKSMNHDIAEGKMFEDLVQARVFTKAQATRLRKNLNDLIDHMLPNANILDMNEAYGKGNRPYKAYKPNSDPLYVISLDFSTLCRKRLMTQYVIEQLQLRENRPMTAEEQLAIRSMLLDYRKKEQALQVACAMCYVESARLKAPKQMETYFKNTESVLTKYFAMKNKDFNDRVKKAQEDFKVERDYDAKAPKSAMTTAERKAFDQMSDRMRKGYEPTAEEKAIIETAKGLPKSSYLTAANLTKLNVEHPEIYDAYTTYIRNATRSKSLESDIPYYYGDSREAVSAGFIEKVNAENGMRFDSWSDFQMEHMLDMITAVIDLSVRGSKMHGYTKFPEMVRIFGKTGMQFNLSGVTEGNGFDEKGNLVFSDIEGMSKEDAIKLRKDFPETAGFQCIGVSDDHIRALLRADYIDYVIPYHISGLNKTMRRMAGIYKWEDYTKEQHATKDPKAKKPEGAENWQVEPVWSEFYTGEGENGLDIMQKTAQRYVDMCHERGLIPKFDKFRDEPGYWKLLVDRKMVNQKTGKIIEQQPVRPDFDFKLIKKEIDREVASYDPSLEQRALDYVVEHFDAVNSRIQDLKKQGTKEKKTKKQMQTVGNEMLQAVAEGVKPGVRFSLKTNRRDTSRSDYERAYEMVYGKQGKPKTVEQAANQEAVGVIDRLQSMETPKQKTKAKPLPKPGERKTEAVQEDPIPAEDLAYMDELVDAAVSTNLEAEFKTARDMIPGGKVEKTPLTEKGKDIGGFAYRKFVDSGDEIRKAGKQSGDKYLYYYYNQAKASTATAQNMIAMRQTDVNGKEVGESLVDIFGPIKKKGQEYFKDFQDYLLHRHNINRMGTKEERRMQAQATRYLWDFEDENPEYKGWTLPEIRDAADDGDQIAKEYLEIKKEKAFWDSKVKPVFNYEMTPEKSQARVRQYEGRYPEFKDLAKRVYAYNQNLMKFRVDSGLISKDTAEYLRKRYPNYVPTFHQQDGVSTAPQGKGTKVGKTVKKATGNTGDNPFLDMDKAMAQQTMNVVRESAKNRFGQRLLNEDISQDYIINVESLAQQKALAELHDEDGFKSEQTNKDNTFTVYKDGKAYEITMTPAMYEGIKSLSKTGESDILAVKAAIGANNIYKKAITSWNPIFTVKNLAKDLQDSLLYTTASPKEFAKNYAEAVRQIKNNGDEWKLYQALGGTAASVYNMDRGVELPKDGAWAKLIGKIQYLNLAVEQAPRLAEFMATVDKGNRTQEELMEAMYRAADITTNFGRSGDWTKMLNSSFVPFLNPSIQGVDKLVRTFKDNPKQVGPWLSLAGRVAMLGMAPAIINAALFGDEEDYDELNQRDKDNNFMMPLRLLNDEWDGMWLKVPRGRALAAMGAITNAGIGLAKGKDVDVGELISTVWSNVGVVNPMTSNIMRPLVQTALFDKDNPGKTWYGSDIESKSMQSKKPGERYDERTDEFSKRLGKAVGLSPAKINYLLDSYTGVFGDIALPLLTPTNPVGKNPLSKAFVTDSTTSNRLSGDFYDMGDQLKYDEQEGDTSATIAYNYWSKVSQELSEVNEEIRKMENDKGLDSKAKRKKYKDLKAKANEILRDGTANVEAFRKAAEEYDGEINEDTEWDVLVALTRDVLGAEKALEYDGKTTYEKAQEIVKVGGSYESYYDYLQAERALNDIMDAESNLNTLNERNITGAKLTEAQNKVDLLNKEHQELVEKSMEGSNGWKPTSTDRKLSVLESLELPEEEAFAIWKMKILDSEQRYKMEVLEEAGLPQMDYFRYKMAVKHLNGYEDSSEPGTTKRNSKKDMRVPIINSLDLTPAQKDILYLDVENWAKSGLYKTPWH